MPRRKILLLSTSPFPYRDNITDGPGFRAWNLFELLAHKHDIVILSLYESYHLTLDKEYELVENKLRVRCVSHRPTRVANLISEENPDVLYLPWSSTPFLSRLSKKIPTIIDYVGAGLLEAYAAHGYIPTLLLNLKLKSFWLGDFFMTAGRRERYYLLGLLAASKKLSYPSDRRKEVDIYYIPMTPPRDHPFLQARTSSDHSKPLTLLVAGAFLPWYKYDVFFETIELLLRKGETKFRVVMMGGNPRDPGLERTIKTKALRDEIREKITYTGVVPFKKRISYYMNADAVVTIPSNALEDELSQRTRIVDSMWAGIPVVTPARDEYSETVTAWGAGFTYDSEDPAGLAEVLQTLIRHPEKLAAARKNTRVVIEKAFDPHTFLHPLDDFIQNPYVEPSRESPRSWAPDLLLYLRDALRALRRR